MTPVMNVMSRILAAVAVVLLTGNSALLAQQGEPATPPLLVNYGMQGAPIEGDHDFTQTITFSIPASLSDTLYLRVFDPDSAGLLDTIYGSSWPVEGDTVTRFSLFGGPGAFVGSGAGLAGGIVAGGTRLFQKSFGKDHGTDGQWRTLTKIDVGDGELRGRRRVFRVDVEGVTGNDGNVFDIAVSTAAGENQRPRGLRIFSYLPTLRVPDDKTLVELRFWVPFQATELTVNNFDASGGAVKFTSQFRSVNLVSSGQGEWDKSTFAVSPRERGAMAAVTVAGGAEIPNDLSVYITDQAGKAVPVMLPLRAWGRRHNRPEISALITPRGCGGMVFDASATRNADADRLTTLWRFGDGRVLQGARVERSFAPGEYSVRLEVRDSSGLVGDGAARDMDFSVKARPVARIAGPLVVAQGAPVRFDAAGSTTGARWRIRAFEWGFPGGVTASGAAASNVFSKPGPQTIRLLVRDDSGLPCDSAQTTFDLLVNAAPVAEAGADAFVAVGETVAFDGAGSTDANGDVLAYAWDFGDASIATGATVSHAFKTPGLYRVGLAVDDGAGVGNSVARDTVVVRVNAPPVARPGGDFTVAIGETIRFDGSGSSDADGKILIYAWDFGNGRGATGVGPVYAYPKIGSYRVQLTVTDDSGLANKTTSAAMQVTVVDAANQAPVADAGGPREVIVGAPVRFDATGSTDPDGNIIAYEWDFGDGGKASGLTPVHSFWATGIYQVRLTVRDDSGLANDTASATATVNVIDRPNTAPSAAAGPDRTVTVGEIIAFNAGQSTDPDGNIIAYNWDFGNGDTARGIAVQYAYPKSGRYVATLTATDDSDLTNAREQARVVVQVDYIANTAPLAVAGADVAAAIDQVVAFDARASTDTDGNLIVYEWEFGDGATGRGPRVAHAYKKSGIYKVTLTVGDDSGRPNDRAADQLTVVVNQPPVAAAGPDRRVTASVVRFDGTGSTDSDGQVATYKWNFGDGATGTGPRPAHVYRSPGTYTISLTVGDDSGTIRNTATDSMTVRVNAIPIADAGPEIVAAPGEALAFDGGGSLDPDGRIAGYFWDFDDGTVAAGKLVEHTFNKPGTYNVVLKVADDSGDDNAVDYAQALIIINRQPVADAGFDIVAAPGQAVSLNGAGSFDTDGEIVEYRWDIAGRDQPSMGASVSQKFAAPGLYEVQLTVVDDSGTLNGVASDKMTVRINNPPVAQAGADIVSNDPRIVFDAGGSVDPDGDGLSYRWNFGDGTTALGARVTHTYESGGTYPVVLGVNDNTGLANAADTDTLIVGINRRPIAVAGQNRDVCTGDVVVFDGGASSDPEGGALKYLWRFGDGSSSTIVNPTRTFKSSGVYPVTLTVRDNSGLSNSSNSDRISVRVQPAPTADAGRDMVVYANQRVQFDGSKSTDLDGVVNRFSWDFGDGSSGGGDKPSNVFRQPGTYRVSLTIEGDQVGVCSNTATGQISVRVVAAPVADFAAPAATPVNAPTLFDASLSSTKNGSISNWTWDFGDGTGGSGEKIEHSYAKPGKYLVTLSIESNTAEKSFRDITKSRDIVVNGQPIANAGPDQLAGTGEPVNFDAAASRDPDGGLVAYVWDFGDGQSATGLQPLHTYRIAGKYTVTLTVSDDTGLANADASDTMTVEVRDPPAVLASGAAVGCSGKPMRWTANLPGGTPATSTGAAISWNFGDGTTAQGANVTHTYRRPGRYQVTMFTDNSSQLAGSRRFSTSPVRINQPPVAKAGPDRLICPGSVVQFDGSGSRDADGTLQSYRWDFGDGTTSNQMQPVHAFQQPGTYKVRLTVGDDAGVGCSSAVDETTVVVNRPPVAKIGNGRLAYIGGANDAFLLDGSGSGDQDGDALSYEWTLGDGTTLYGQRVRQMFIDVGEQPVTLTVRDSTGLMCGIATDKVRLNVRRRN